MFYLHVEIKINNPFKNSLKNDLKINKFTKIARIRKKTLKLPPLKLLIFQLNFDLHKRNSYQWNLYFIIFSKLQFNCIARENKNIGDKEQDEVSSFKQTCAFFLSNLMDCLLLIPLTCKQFLQIKIKVLMVLLLLTSSGPECIGMLTNWKKYIILNKSSPFLFKQTKSNYVYKSFCV